MAKMKKNHEKEQELDKDNENLEQEYNKAKTHLDFLREFKKNNKNHRVSQKNEDKYAQTLEILPDKSFDSYFEEDTK